MSMGGSGSHHRFEDCTKSMGHDIHEFQGRLTSKMIIVRGLYKSMSFLCFKSMNLQVRGLFR